MLWWYPIRLRFKNVKQNRFVTEHEARLWDMLSVKMC